MPTTVLLVHMPGPTQGCQTLAALQRLPRQQPPIPGKFEIFTATLILSIGSPLLWHLQLPHTAPYRPRPPLGLPRMGMWTEGGRLPPGFASLLHGELTIHQGNVQSPAHVVLDTAHEPGRGTELSNGPSMACSPCFPPCPTLALSREAHILSSRQILGPMTLAAPLTTRKARCSSGHGWGRPHLYFLARGSVGTTSVTPGPGPGGTGHLRGGGQASP